MKNYFGRIRDRSPMLKRLYSMVLLHKHILFGIGVEGKSIWLARQAPKPASVLGGVFSIWR